MSETHTHTHAPHIQSHAKTHGHNTFDGDTSASVHKRNLSQNHCSLELFFTLFFYRNVYLQHHKKEGK